MEPALKPALALSNTKHIAVMATRNTLGSARSARFAALLAAQSSQARFTLMPCDGLAEAVEASAQSLNKVELTALCARLVKATDSLYLKNEIEPSIDTIVLGCTH